jgi:hypothetical protein
LLHFFLVFAEIFLVLVAQTGAIMSFWLVRVKVHERSGLLLYLIDWSRPDMTEGIYRVVGWVNGSDGSKGLREGVRIAIVVVGHEVLGWLTNHEVLGGLGYHVIVWRVGIRWVVIAHAIVGLLVALP